MKNYCFILLVVFLEAFYVLNIKRKHRKYITGLRLQRHTLVYTFNSIENKAKISKWHCLKFRSLYMTTSSTVAPKNQFKKTRQFAHLKCNKVFISKIQRTQLWANTRALQVSVFSLISGTTHSSPEVYQQ